MLSVFGDKNIEMTNMIMNLPFGLHTYNLETFDTIRETRTVSGGSIKTATRSII